MKFRIELRQKDGTVVSEWLEIYYKSPEQSELLEDWPHIENKQGSRLYAPATPLYLVVYFSPELKVLFNNVSFFRNAIYNSERKIVNDLDGRRNNWLCLCSCQSYYGVEDINYCVNELAKVFDGHVASLSSIQEIGGKHKPAKDNGLAQFKARMTTLANFFDPRNYTGEKINQYETRQAQHDERASAQRDVFDSLKAKPSGNFLVRLRRTYLSLHWSARLALGVGLFTLSMAAAAIFLIATHGLGVPILLFLAAKAPVLITTANAALASLGLAGSAIGAANYLLITIAIGSGIVALASSLINFDLVCHAIKRGMKKASFWARDQVLIDDDSTLTKHDDTAATQRFDVNKGQFAAYEQLISDPAAEATDAAADLGQGAGKSLLTDTLVTGGSAGNNEGSAKSQPEGAVVHIDMKRA